MKAGRFLLNLLRNILWFGGFCSLQLVQTKKKASDSEHWYATSNLLSLKGNFFPRSHDVLQLWRLTWVDVRVPAYIERDHFNHI